MKLVPLLMLIAGLAAAIGLIVAFGAGQVADAVASVGIGILWVVIIRAVTIGFAGTAWWLLFPRDQKPSHWACVVLRVVREGANDLLPVAQVGGDVIGARLLTRFGVEPMLAGASVLVDVLVQVATELIFAVVGLVLLIHFGGNAEIVRGTTIGLAVAVPVLIGFFVAQRRAGRAVVERLLARLVGQSASAMHGAVETLYDWLRVLYRRRLGLLWASLVHLAVWFVSAVTTLIALRFMGFPVTYGESIVIEGLGQAVRAAAFAVPGGIGVQEGGFIALCAVFGIPADAALALSLVKRVGEIATGGPGLLIWQVMEGRSLLRGWRDRRKRRNRAVADDS